MGLKCKIYTLPSGEKEVRNPDGSVNKLFQDALNITQDRNEALTMWASSYLEDFQVSTGKTEDTATIQDVVAFYNTPVEERLSGSEKLEIKEIMRKSGIESLSELASKLNTAFKPNGTFEMNVPAAVNSGIFSEEELENIDQADLLSMINKINSHLTKENFTVEVESNKVYYKNSEVRTVLGTFRKASEKEVDEELFNNLAKGMSLEEAVTNSSFPEFISSFETSPTFRKKLTDRVNSLSKVPVISFLGNSLSKTDNTYYTTLKNTISVGINPAVVKAELDYIASMTPAVFNIAKPQIEKILREIEEDMTEVNIDVIGLTTLATDQQGVVEVLQGLDSLVRDPNEANIQAFSALFTSKVKGELSDPVSFEQLREEYKNLSVVRLYTNKSETELFENHGLIKIGENLYHKIKRGQVSEMYDYLYNLVRDGKINIKITSPIENKPAVLSELATFVNSRQLPIETPSAEEYSLAQVVFNHAPVSRGSKTTTISQLQTVENERYLKTDFVEDFYNYVLSEKLKNSEVYQTVLSKFQFTDDDISLVGEVVSIDSIKYQKELEDYIRLKKDSGMDHLLSPATAAVTEDDLFHNFPEMTSPFTNEVIVEGQFVLTTNTASDYHKLNGKLYKKAASQGNRHAFVEVEPNTDPTYLEKAPKTTPDQKLAEDFLMNSSFGVAQKTDEKFYTVKQPFKLNTPQKQDITRLVSTYLTTSLGYPINILTEQQMIAEAKKRGYDTLDAMVAGEIAAARLDSYYGTEAQSPLKELAVQMEEAGATPNVIFQTTGWEKRLDGKWRFEIPYGSIEKPNSEPTIVNGMIAPNEEHYLLKDIYKVDELYIAYPELNNTKVILFEAPEGSKYNLFTGFEFRENVYLNKKYLEDGFITDDRSEAARTIIHEVSHIVQKIEGFAEGSNEVTIFNDLKSSISRVRDGVEEYAYEATDRRIDRVLKQVSGSNLQQVANMNLTDSDLQSVAKHIYLRLTGEVEARNIANRYAAGNLALEGLPMSITEDINIEKQIQFLKVKETIYGFYDNATKEIYLTEELLNPGTLVHELWHALKPVLKNKALNGDPDSQILLNTMDALVEEGFNEKSFSDRYDAFMGRGVNFSDLASVDFQLLGEKGAQRDAEAYAKLQEAKRMREEGVEDSIIEATTGWSEYKGKWTYFDANALKQLKFKDNKFPEVGVETTLGEVLEDNILFKYYPELKEIKIEHEYGVDGEQFARTSFKDGGKIWINEARALEAYRGTYLGGVGRSDIEVTLQDSIVASYVHEIAHIIQDIELLPKGGDPYTVVRRAAELVGEKANISTSIVKKIDDKLEETLEDDDRKVLQAAKVVVDNLLNGDTNAAQFAYEMLYGEVEARAIEMAYLKLRNNNLQEGITLNALKEALAAQEGIPLEEQLVISRDSSEKMSARASYINFQILGERGAANLDALEESTRRLDNLSIAKDMESKGELEETILLATGWQKNLKTGKWKYEIDTNFSVNTTDIQGKTLGEVLDYPELFKAHPEAADVLLDVVNYEDVDYDGNFNINRNEISISSYLLDEEASSELKSTLAHEIQHVVQNLEGWQPTSKEDIWNLARSVSGLDVQSPYSDVEDNSIELANSLLEDIKWRNKEAETVSDLTRMSDSEAKVVQYYLENGLRLDLGSQEQIAGLRIGESTVSSSLIEGDFPSTKEGVVSLLESVISDFNTRNGISGLQEVQEKLKGELTEDDRSDAESQERFLSRMENYLGEVINDNFEITSTKNASPVSKVMAAVESNDQLANTSVDSFLTKAKNFFNSLEGNEWDIYWNSTSEIEARNVQTRLGMTPQERATNLLSNTEDVADVDQLNFQAANLEASVYEPRPNESKSDYISRMKEELEANLLGDNAEAYFERIAKDNNMSDSEKRSFIDKVRAFIKDFSNWLANQLGFKGMTPEQAEKLTTQDILDRVTTSMLKGDYTEKVGTLQTILDSNLELVTLYSEKDNVQEKMNACG